MNLNKEQIRILGVLNHIPELPQRYMQLALYSGNAASFDKDLMELIEFNLVVYVPMYTYDHMFDGYAYRRTTPVEIVRGRNGTK